MKLNIPHVAKLANLPITSEEEKLLEKQLSETLTYVEMLQEIDTKQVEPTAQVTGLENVLREDVSNASLTQDQAISNAKKQHEGFFAVDAILETH